MVDVWLIVWLLNPLHSWLWHERQLASAVYTPETPVTIAHPSPRDR